MDRPSSLAALDCGTNSTRLLIVDADGATVTREMRITRLGEGVDSTHVLSDTAIGRTLTVLGEFRSMMDHADVGSARLVATSAVRDAHNGPEFLTAASGVVGFEAELLSGDEEGRLAYSGASAGLSLEPQSLVVVDIGGGSTEIVAQHNGTVHAHSMDIGCVRVTERFLRDDPPTVSQVGSALTAIGVEIARMRRALPFLNQLGADAWMVGLAGTVSTLSALEAAARCLRPPAYSSLGVDRTGRDWVV